MKFFSTNSLITLFLIVHLLPGLLNAQDADISIEEVNQRRNELIDSGLLQENFDSDPVQHLNTGYTLDDAIYTYKFYESSTDLARAIDFRPNGSRLYVVGRGSRNVVEYHLSEPWEIQTSAYVREFDLTRDLGTESQPDIAPHGIYIRKSDGARMWIVNRTEIWEYTLATPWNVSTATQTGYRDISSHALRAHDIEFKPDGRVMYVDDRFVGVVFQYNLSTPWDINTATLNYSLDISRRQIEVRGTQLSDDGRRMFLNDTGRREILEYSLTTPFDLRSADYVGSLSVVEQTEENTGMFFRPDLSRFFIGDALTSTIFQYQFSFPPDPQNSTISVDRTDVQANDLNSAKVTVTARDKDGKRIAFFPTTLRAISGNLQFSPDTVITNSNGEAVFDVTNSIIETVQYEAVSGGIDVNGSVSVSFFGFDSGLSTIQNDNEIVEADGDNFAEIKVTLKDKDNNPFSNTVVDLLPLNGNSIIEEVERVTNSEGNAIFRVYNQIPEQVIFNARGRTQPRITLDDTVEISFIPRAPVSLSATDTEGRSFTANWEVVDFAESYRLDVSTDSTFTNYVSGYENRNVGLTTFEVVENLQPGIQYFYRVRAIVGDLIGANSRVMETTTFPDTPIASSSTNRNAVTFTAVWQPAEGARYYQLDVASDPNFETIISEYENIDVGNVTTYKIDNLDPGTFYYYRVRSVAGPRTSENSNTIETSTLAISPELSSIEQEQLRILANGTQSNEIRIMIKSLEGIPLFDLDVEISPVSGQSVIDPVQSQTDTDGLAIFSLSSLRAETVDYFVHVHGTEVGTFTIEFLPDLGSLALGNNYPNPFNGSTTIPVTLPQTMDIEIMVFDQLGRPVQTVIDTRLEPGYYEIPLNVHGRAAGVYFYRLFTEGKILTNKMLYIH
jgi:hypothetical protein